MRVRFKPYRTGAVVAAIGIAAVVAACSTSAKSSSAVHHTSATAIAADEPTAPRRRLLVLEADNGASIAACSRKGAVRDGNGSSMCLKPGQVLATGADVVAARAVHTAGGWFVRVVLTPAATARVRFQPVNGLVHEIVNGWLVNDVGPAVPVLVGNGSFDRGAAQDLASDLRPSTPTP